MLTVKQYCKRFMLWTALITFVIVGVIGLCFGHVVEATLFAEVAKWVVMGLGVSAITTVFAYVLGPVFYHHGYEKKQLEKEAKK